MKTFALLAVLCAAACGADQSSDSTTPSENIGPTSEPSAVPATDATGHCCCELASDPPSFQMIEAEACHEEQHGECAATLDACAG